MPHVASSNSSQPKDPMDKVAEKVANTMDYPVLKKLADKFKGQLFQATDTTFSSLTEASSRPPRDTYMGPVGYTPASRPESGIPSTSAMNNSERLPPLRGRGRPLESFWNLPTAHAEEEQCWYYQRTLASTMMRSQDGNLSRST
ncbi:hypothetical protein OIU84_028268 [Salix udensis]|uniref:Uncharacterized protein n=1 Tax=Salix udensis TaxID=889485 RepID=A0AAD6KCN8_9ROSI|nr:hypothetical protein OIU84_028268 [Salix udensis]